MNEYARSICAGEVITLVEQSIGHVGHDCCYQMRDWPDGHGGSTKVALYVARGEPDCMWGHALYHFGVPCNRMAHRFDTINWMLARLGIVVSPMLAYHMRQAQILADLGYPWGIVLDQLKRWLLNDAERLRL